MSETISLGRSLDRRPRPRFWKRNWKGDWKDSRRRALLQRVGIEVETTTEHAGRLEAVGDGSGAWALAVELVPDSPALWTFGIGRDLSFEREFVRRFGATVRAFDPTPQSLAWVAEQDLPAAIRCEPIGLGDTDGTWAFEAPGSERSIDHGSGGDGELALPVRSLASLIEESGRGPDLLKVDIEGGERRVLEDLVASGASQVLIEFHHGMYGCTFEDTLQALERFAAAGYRRAVISHRGLEFTFVHESAIEERVSS